MIKQQVVLGLMSVSAIAASVLPAWADTFPDSFISVPEPASLLLFGTGAGAVLLFKRLRRGGRRD